MDDLISRQAAIDAVAESLKGVFVESKDIAEKMIGKLPSAQPEQRWIPVTERMPEEPFGCLVTVWDEQPMTGEMFENLLPYFVGWDGEQWNDGDGMPCPLEVIAWMPLPKPYREEEVHETD